MLNVIIGPMYAGKTEELIRLISRQTYANKNILVFKPSIDNRYSDDEIVTHYGKKIKAINIDTIDDILTQIENSPIKIDSIFIDEVQFLQGELIHKKLMKLASNGITIFASGLNMDSEENPFPIVANLLAVADNITMLKSVCVKCGSDATRSKKLVNNTDTVLLGSTGIYEARCTKCYEE